MITKPLYSLIFIIHKKTYSNVSTYNLLKTIAYYFCQVKGYRKSAEKHSFIWREKTVVYNKEKLIQESKDNFEIKTKEKSLKKRLKIKWIDFKELRRNYHCKS